MHDQPSRKVPELPYSSAYSTREAKMFFSLAAALMFQQERAGGVGFHSSVTTADLHIRRPKRLASYRKELGEPERGSARARPCWEVRAELRNA